MNNKFSISNTSLASIKEPDNVVAGVNELAKKLEIKTAVKKVCDNLSNKIPVLDALKILDSARHLSDQTKELCKNLDDTSVICELAIKIIHKGPKDASKVEAPKIVLAYLDFFNKIPVNVWEEIPNKVKQKIQEFKKEIVQKENEIEQKEQMQKLQESLAKVEQKEDEIIDKLEFKSPTNSPSPTPSSTSSAFSYNKYGAEEETASVMGGEIDIEPLHQ